MKVNDFLKMLMLAAEVKSLYVMGGWGFPLNKENKDRTQKNSFNKREDRKKKIYAASDDTFAFDCCGLVKAILWGWNGDKTKRNGGAVYASNGVNDYDAKELMFKGCSVQSKDFSNIVAGELLWLDGHCGVYLGNGLAIESTTKWNDKVQITAVANIGSKPGYNSRTWTYHGKLKYVDYSGVTPEPTPADYKVGEIYTVKCKGPLRVRSGSDTDKTILSNLYKGDKVLVKDVVKDKDGNTWLNIEGYAAAKYDGEVWIE